MAVSCGTINRLARLPRYSRSISCFSIDSRSLVKPCVHVGKHSGGSSGCRALCVSAGIYSGQPVSSISSE